MSQPLISLNAWAAAGKPTGMVMRNPLIPDTVIEPSPGLPSPVGRTVRPVRGRMNGTEKRYAQRLDNRIRIGEVVIYWYEAIKFRLADGSWFTPDFFVVLASGLCEIHECKGGFIREAAQVRLKITSDLYWSFPVKLVKERPVNVFTVIEVGK